MASPVSTSNVRVSEKGIENCQDQKKEAIQSQFKEAQKAQSSGVQGMRLDGLSSRPSFVSSSLGIQRNTPLNVGGSPEKDSPSSH